MGGFLRFLALFALLVAFLALVVLPIALTPILTETVRGMGLRSDTLRVSVELFDPFLVFGRARSVHLDAIAADLDPVTIQTMDVTVRDVSFFDRTWTSVSGEITDLSITTGGQTLTVSSVRVDGPAAAAEATARMSAAEAEGLIAFAADREGFRLDDVQLTDAGMIVTLRGVQASGRLEVRSGTLVLVPGTGSGAGGVPLIQPAPTDPLQLEEAWISAGGLNIRGVIDTTRLAADL